MTEINASIPANSDFYSESMSTRGQSSADFNVSGAVTVTVLFGMAPYQSFADGSNNLASFTTYTTFATGHRSIPVESAYIMLKVANATSSAVEVSIHVEMRDYRYTPIGTQSNTVATDKQVLLVRHTNDMEVDAANGLLSTSIFSMSAHGSLSSTENLLRGGGLFVQPHGIGFFDATARAVSVSSRSGKLSGA